MHYRCAIRDGFSLQRVSQVPISSVRNEWCDGVCCVVECQWWRGRPSLVVMEVASSIYGVQHAREDT